MTLKDICLKTIVLNPFLAPFIYLLPTSCVLMLNDMLLFANCIRGGEFTTYLQFLKYWPRRSFSVDICIADYWLLILHAVKYEGVGRIKFFHFICHCEEPWRGKRHLGCFLRFLTLLKENEYHTFLIGF